MAFKLATVVGALALLAHASPIAKPNPSPQYSGYVEYVIDSQGDAPAELNSPYVGAIEVHSGQGMTFTRTHTIGTSFTVGGDLGLDPGAILSLGLSASFTTTTSDSTALGASADCPPNASPDTYSCSLMITPNMWQVNGHVNWHETAIDSLIVSSATYTALFPKTDESGVQFTNVDVCLCPNPANMIYPAHESSVDGVPIYDCPGTCGS